MKIQPMLVLSAANFVLLIGLLMQALPVTAQAPAGILRGSGLEIVDGMGRLRATISIQPESSTNDETYSETVLFRLINADGQPSVKISASQTGAGLSFVGGDDASYLILEAEGSRTQLKLVELDKPERVVAP